jgi:small subunit ribosomal protein S5
MAGLESLRTPDEVAELRGLSINQVLGLTSDAGDGAADANGAVADTDAAVEAASGAGEAEPTEAAGS